MISNFGLATNRNWKTEDGEQHEEADYHRLVAFGKLAEFCSEYVRKGRKLYIEGRLHSHSRTDNQVVQKAVTEIILDDVVLLDNKPQEAKAEPVTQTESQQPATVV